MASRSLLPRPLSRLICLIVTLIPRTRAESTVDDSRCNCYITNGSDVAYFSNHKFYDFRDLSKYQGAPGLLSEPKDTSLAPVSSDYFNDEKWTSFWELQSWNNSASLTPGSNAAVLRINSRNNVYIEQNTDSGSSSSTFLTLRTARQPMFQSAAEIATVAGDFQFLSMRMFARTLGATGGCTAMFTYRQPGGPESLQEADLEMLTKYPKDQIQVTNQPAIDNDGQLAPMATENVSLPMGSTWDSWNTYRMDWTPRRSTWYVNGQEIANISFQTPRDPSRVHVNAWSDGGNWTGIMPFKTEAHLQIQWWELLYNATSRKPESDVCHAVCSIDGSNTVGKAVMISNSMAPGRLLSQRQGVAEIIAWMPSLTILAMLLFSSSLLRI